MNKTLMTAIAFFAFGLGCVASTVYAPLAVPPAKAQNTTRWEQICIPWRDRTTDTKIAWRDATYVNKAEEGWNRVLKRYGQEGWELVSLVSGETTGMENKTGSIFAACFKRPL